MLGSPAQPRPAPPRPAAVCEGRSRQPDPPKKTESGTGGQPGPPRQQRPNRLPGREGRGRRPGERAPRGGCRPAPPRPSRASGRAGKEGRRGVVIPSAGRARPARTTATIRHKNRGAHPKRAVRNGDSGGGAASAGARAILGRVARKAAVPRSLAPHEHGRRQSVLECGAPRRSAAPLAFSTAYRTQKGQQCGRDRQDAAGRG